LQLPLDFNACEVETCILAFQLHLSLDGADYIRCERYAELLKTGQG